MMHFTADHSRRSLARAASVLVGATMALALTLPAFANTGHQSGWGVSWNDAGFQGSEGECSSASLGADEVLWHFVQTQVPADLSGGQLTATFENAGAMTVGSYMKAGSVLHWEIVTGRDTLLVFGSDVTSPGQLNLSHICAAVDEATPEATPESPSEAPSEIPSESPSEAPSENPSENPSETPGNAPENPSEAPSNAPGNQQPTATPSSQVEGAVGTPQVTPPPTDTVGGEGNGTSSTGWLLAIAGIVALVVSLVIRNPARHTTR